MFNPDSPIFFPVALREAAFKDKHGNFHVVPKRKAIVRELGGKPITLAFVTDTFNLVHNQELFEAIEHQLAPMIAYNSVVVHDDVSHNGQRVGRTYRITSHDDKLRIGDVTHFELFVRNAYGNGSFRLGWSMRRLVCMNKLTVSAGSEMVYRKHTKSLDVPSLMPVVDRFRTAYEDTLVQVDNVWTQKIGDYKQMLPVIDAFPQINDTLRTMINHAVYKHEQRVASFWELVNGFTYWASNGPTRGSNEANVRWERDERVNRWLHTKEVKEYLAA